MFRSTSAALCFLLFCVTVCVTVAQIGVCPTSSPSLTPCSSCPADQVSCSSTTDGVKGYGGCAPIGANVVYACTVDKTGYCFYCGGIYSTPQCVDNNAQPGASFTCDGQAYTLGSGGSSSSGSSSSSSCFAGSEMLQLESGAVVTMDKVQVGDRVLVASLDGKSTFFSPVMVIPHAANSDKATFVQLSTVSGKDVKMTAEHLLLSGACGAPLSLVQAGSVEVGACVSTMSGEEVVSSVSIVSGEGMYTVVPETDSLLVVNGVVASPFAVNHMLASAFYSIYRVVPFVSRNGLVRQAVSLFGEMVAPMVSA